MTAISDENLSAILKKNSSELQKRTLFIGVNGLFLRKQMQHLTKLKDRKRLKYTEPKFSSGFNRKGTDMFYRERWKVILTRQLYNNVILMHLPRPAISFITVHFSGVVFYFASEF